MSPGRPRIPFRRRNFFIKHGFQARFALYPLGLFFLFICGAGLYLGWYLHDALEFQLYLPHSRLENPWDLLRPALARTAVWGGAFFLAALLAWGWGRFGRLRSDLDRLAEWMTGLVAGNPTRAPSGISDLEVRALGEALHKAAVSFEAWEGEARKKARAVVDAVGALTEPDPSRVPEIRAASDELRAVLDRVVVDEELR